ncbi:hypothetical protein SLS58_011364 [Diplodia intermedia]|uniref:Uncharacterized protein n=1 Tax=Diplodia intermedia TaxID=856260 RepID=A0ABR3SYY5_9PEZI
MALDWLDEQCRDLFSSLLKSLFEVFDDAEAHGVTGAAEAELWIRASLLFLYLFLDNADRTLSVLPWYLGS